MFRLPFMWERLQPTVNGPLDAAYLALLDDALKSFNEAGAVAVLDVHNCKHLRPDTTALISAHHFLDHSDAHGLYRRPL